MRRQAPLRYSTNVVQVFKVYEEVLVKEFITPTRQWNEILLQDNVVEAAARVIYSMPLTEMQIGDRLDF